MVHKGVIELQYISTDDQTADVFTKPLPRVKFDYLEVEENISLLEKERRLRDTYHTFAQAPLLV